MLPALWGLFLFLGLWRYSLSMPENTPGKIWFYNGKEVILEAVICNEPDIRNNHTKYEVCAESVEFSREKIKVLEKILVTTNLYPAYRYGDLLEIKCELEAPEKFEDFSYDRYLARFNIYSSCFYPQIKFLASNNGNYFYEKIFKLKNRFHDAINFGLPEPTASLAGPLILGYKKGVSPYWQEKFSQTGLSHILAISGMNISILAALVMSLLLGTGFSRQKSFLASSIFLVAYVIMVGAPASAMRAGLMGFLVLWAINLGRLNKLTNSLVLSATILLLINPKLLRDDVGFQLSFLAVLGMIYFPPIFERAMANFSNFKNWPKILKYIFQVLNLTLAAQIFTLPIIAYNFSQISLIAPISNLLVLWVILPLTIIVFFAMILGAIFPFAVQIFFFPAFLLLKYMMLMVDWTARVPYAYVSVEHIWAGWMVAYYLIVGYIVVMFRLRLKKELNKN